MPAAVDISGERYGRLVALRYAGHLRVGSQPKRAFLFRCDCGSEVVRTLMDVRRLDTMSCGCLKRDNMLRKPAHNRLPAGESSFRALFSTYQARARELAVPFELSVETFAILVSSKCDYCNAAPAQRKRATRSSFGEVVYNGVDRVDNTRGYVLGNVVACCGQCNKAKRDLSVSDFLEWIRSVYRWRCDED